MGGRSSNSKGDIHDAYEFKEKLGQGSFATVKRAVKKSDKTEYAIKVIKKTKLKPEEQDVLQEEVRIMSKLDHPSCVRMYEIFDTRKKMYMVMELLSGGELFDRIVAKGSFSEHEASVCMREVVGAIKYLHGIGIVHRDLKPENLIYATKSPESPLKITDFGLAKLRPHQEEMHTACGTPGYVAPEVLKNTKYGPAVDMWSMGVILYILLCGFPPFYHESTAELYKQIKKGQYDFPEPYWTPISREAKDLVRKLLTVDPKLRYSPDQVLAHEWITAGKASKEQLGASYSERLRTLQARRVLRKAVNTMLILNRFNNRLKILAAKQRSSKKR